mgnify:CR=1 FL=1
MEEAVAAAAASPDGAELLLGALSAPGPLQLGALASGFISVALARGAEPGECVLFRAMEERPDICAHFVELVPSALLTVRLDLRRSEGKRSRVQRFQSLEPFLRRILLRAGVGAREIPREVGSRLHGLLIRLAVSESDLQAVVLGLLQSLLPWYGRGSILDWTWRLGFATDLADVAEEFGLEDLSWRIADALVQLIEEFHGRVSVRPALLQMGRLLLDSDGQNGLACVARIAPLLPRLELQDQNLLMSLLCTLLADASGPSSALGAGEGGTGASASHLLLLPALCHKAQLGRENDCRASAAFFELMKRVDSIGDPLHTGAGAGTCCPSSFPAAVEALKAFSGPSGTEALASCLKSLGGKFVKVGAADVTRQNGTSDDEEDKLEELVFVEHSILTALISRSGLDFKVFRTALKHHRESVEFSVTMMPFILSRLHEASTSSNSRSGGREAEEVLGTLEGLVSLGCNPFSVGMVGKVLTALSAPQNPIHVQATALRLLLNLWEENDQSFPFLKGALARECPDRDPLILRYARGMAISAVSAIDSYRAVDLLKPIQFLLEDPDDHVRALGFEAVHSLCGDDTLDFYAAWRFLSKRFPRLPGQPRTARGWIKVQGNASMDAMCYPEAAKEALQNIWDASKSPIEEVREGSYRALLCFPLELMEKLEFPVQTEDFAKMLRNESAVSSLPLIAEVLKRAFVYDYVNRRSVMVRNHNDDTPSSEHKNVLARVSRLLPKRICDFWLGNTVPTEAKLCCAAAHSCFLPRRDSEPNCDGKINPAPIQYATEMSRMVLYTGWRGVSSEVTMPRMMSSFMSRWFLSARSAVEPLNDTLTAYHLVEGAISQAEFEHPHALDNFLVWRAHLCAQLKGTPEASGVASRFLAASISRYHEQATTVDRKCALLRAIATVVPCVQDEAALRAASNLMCEALSPTSNSPPGYGHVVRVAAVQAAEVFQHLESRSQSSGMSSGESVTDLLPQILAAVLHPLHDLYPALNLDSLILSSPYRLKERPPAAFPRLADEDNVAAVTGMLIFVGRVAASLATLHSVEFVRSAGIAIISTLELVVSRKLPSETESGVMRGVAAVLPMITESLANAAPQNISEFSRVMQHLQEIACGALHHPDETRAPASECLGAMMHAGINCGFSLKLSQISSVVSSLKASLRASDSSPTLKAACIVGLSNILGAEVGLGSSKSKPTALDAPSASLAAEEGDISVKSPILLEQRAIRLVKDILEEIETKAFLSSEDAQVRRAAFTAIGCLRITQRGISQAGPAINHAASIPGSGATRESLEYLLSELGSNAQDGGEKLATLVDCLSTLPRFPALKWATTLRGLIQHVSSSVQSRSVGLLVSCCDATRFKGEDIQEIWDIFGELFHPIKFCALSLEARRHVLTGFAEVLNSLPQSQVLRQISALPSLAAAWGSGNPSKDGAASTWDCIAAVMKRTEISHFKDCAFEVAAKLLERMEYTSAETGALQCPEWIAAVSCLAQFDAAHLLELLPIRAADASIVRAVAMRSYLVLSGVLSLDHLAPCVAWMLKCTDGSECLQSVLAHSTSTALKSMRPVSCARWLGELLEIASNSADPMAGFLYLTRVASDYLLSDKCPLLRYSGLVSDEALRQQIQILWPVFLNDLKFRQQKRSSLSMVLQIISKIEPEDSTYVTPILNGCRSSLSLNTTEVTLTDRETLMNDTRNCRPPSRRRPSSLED